MPVSLYQVQIAGLQHDLLASFQDLISRLLLDMVHIVEEAVIEVAVGTVHTNVSENAVKIEAFRPQWAAATASMVFQRQKLSW